MGFKLLEPFNLLLQYNRIMPIKNYKDILKLKINQLKNIYQMEHSEHKIFNNSFQT